jgi:hypothetical protein
MRTEQKLDEEEYISGVWYQSEDNFYAAEVLKDHL